ncbi:ABC transporter permease [Agrococcus carbonis]|uniref:Monosaccharide ABC transporter membrane protein, CUT2 family n=1 Tax=Agrococcus carbonis TaxID=684552 RepID=A0A1H1KV55_9MICO|nr:ABC transporter permease [Agrococcus carbonis]SDR66228.1 monosaccharide ABC transporter membrane protein, CUT2 family [Agrococcus carbonis]
MSRTDLATAPVASRAARLLRDPVVIAALIAVLLVVIGGVLKPGFAAPDQIVNMLRVASFLGIIAIGQTIVVLSGGEGIDLSVGVTATLAAILASRTMNGSDALLVPGVLLAIGVAALIGLTNGLGIVLLRIPPFVMTLGMLGVVSGLVLVVTGGVADGRAAPALVQLVNGRDVLGVPGILLVWAVLAVLVTLLLRRTTFGAQLYAVGSSREASRLSGVPVGRTLVVAYVLCSVFAALGGIAMVGYSQQVFLSLADDLTLPSIAAVIIGGTLVSGGVGGYLGSAIGAIVLTVLTSLLTTLSMPEWARTVVQGVVLIALLAVYGRQRRLRA